MPINIDSALRWENCSPEEKAMLHDLQGNILKGHGREHTRNLFLKFTDLSAGRAWVAGMAAQVTNALAQLENAKAHREAKTRGEAARKTSSDPFFALFLTAAGYRALRVPDTMTPGDKAFLDSMKKPRMPLGDPAPGTWQSPFREELHALLLLGHENEAGLGVLAAKIETNLASRGITFGKRELDVHGEFKDPKPAFSDDPDKQVGLLFMAYMSDISNQFEFTQAGWANDTEFTRPGTGIDPVIGQGPARGQACPLTWGKLPADTPFAKFDFRDSVRLLGGEYFFAPSISGLKMIGSLPPPGMVPLAAAKVKGGKKNLAAT